MDKVDWEGLKALEAKATSAPWAWDQRGEKINEWAMGKAFKGVDAEIPIAGFFDGEDTVYDRYVCSHEDTTCNYNDPHLIAGLRNAFPAILAAHERDQRVIAALGRFVGEIISRDDGGLYDLDGGEIQDIAEKCSLFIPTTVAEPCNSDHAYCACAQEGDFPMTCYRLSDIGNLAIDEYDKAKL